MKSSAALYTQQVMVLASLLSLEACTKAAEAYDDLAAKAEDDIEREYWNAIAATMRQYRIRRESND